MFHSKSLIFMLVIGRLSGQSYFHTTHGGGSYTSFSHGHQAKDIAYKTVPVQPSYQTPVQPTYQQPQYVAPAPQPAYHQPAPQPAYHQPAPQPAYHQPAQPAGYGEKCGVGSVEKYAEVCVPTLEKTCDVDTVSNGHSLTEEYKCYPVKKTICTEFEEYETTEVCAVSYALEEIPAEATLSDVKWETTCHEEVICKNPHSAGAYHSAAYCKEQIQKICVRAPVVLPVARPVILKLPKPYNTCIPRDIALPRIKCQQVEDKRCSTVPKAVKNDDIPVDKCTLQLGQEKCAEAPLRLPTQSCLKTFKKTKLVYKEDNSYASRY